MAVINSNLLAISSQQNQNRAQSGLITAMERLSSGLRINSAKDDAAGLAISNRMEANLRAGDQVARGINDGISLMQTAEGGLDSINDILQRSRELAVQASNGTLSDADRASINTEYKELRDEIDRIAMGTEAFGKYPLAPAEATGPKPEPSPSLGETKSIKDVFGASGNTLHMDSEVKPIGFIPTGAKNVTIEINGFAGGEDDIQIFTLDGKHLVGTPVITSGSNETDATWAAYPNSINTPEQVEEKLLTTTNGFPENTKYEAALIGYSIEGESYSQDPKITGSYNGMNFKYTGDGDRFSSDTGPLNDGSTDSYHAIEKLNIDEVKEPLFLAVTGTGIFDVTAQWDAMPDGTSPSTPAPTQAPTSSGTDIVMSANYGQEIDKVTIEPTPSDSTSLGLEDVELDPLEKAREAMEKLQEALHQVDGYRGQYGALTNRFEGAIENLGQQQVNTAVAQSRIMDADYAVESSNMVKSQILQQASTSMLAQANQVPQSVLSLLN